MKDYKQIWNGLSTSLDDASFYVCCLKGDDEEEIRRNGTFTADFLRDVLRLKPTDKVLEIGCGVARIGRELAPHCGEWHGTDISGNMLEYAAERTRGIPNVYYHELPDNSLRIFADNTFDCVYSSIVFMHLDKPDMFTYMRESYRVLKPGGKAYFDTYNLLGPEGWEQFLQILTAYPPGTPRPGHISQFSTPQEMQKFMDESGYDWVHIDGENNLQLVVALGRKGATEWV
jgi:ubiquinone/menaquinone biosynthesis C-methylase UbiE